MNPTGDTNGYAIARRTLILALQALEPLPKSSFILVGAHAVYLRAPEGIEAIAPFTLDGDLAADPAKIRVAHYITDYLEKAGFVLRNQYGGFYWRNDAAPSEKYATNIDILVPQAVANLWDKQTYSRRDVLATQSQRGLEVCLVDHSSMQLYPIEPTQPIDSIEVEVASILALLIAKGWKIGERFEQGSDAFSTVRKDIADIYRLLRAANNEDLSLGLERLPRNEDMKIVVQTGAQHLQKLCGKDGPGLRLLAEILGDGTEARLILGSLEMLSEDFALLVKEAL